MLQNTFKNIVQQGDIMTMWIPSTDANNFDHCHSAKNGSKQLSSIFSSFNNTDTFSTVQLKVMISSLAIVYKSEQEYICKKIFILSIFWFCFSWSSAKFWRQMQLVRSKPILLLSTQPDAFEHFSCWARCNKYPCSCLPLCQHSEMNHLWSWNCYMQLVSGCLHQYFMTDRIEAEAMARTLIV